MDSHRKFYLIQYTQSINVSTLISVFKIIELVYVLFSYKTWKSSVYFILIFGGAGGN